MKKHLLAVAVSIVALAGVAFATQTPETPANTGGGGSTNGTVVGKPSVRPSLNKLLDKRPALPIKKAINKMTTGSIHTGTVATGTKKEEVKQVVRTIVKQNAEDVAAYRAENGYIVRYLLKPMTVAEKRQQQIAIEKAVKGLLATQKSMRAKYEAAAKSGTAMSRDAWNTMVESAVETYRVAVLPYINPEKMEDFDKFIIGRKNLMKAMFDKLEAIRLVKTQ